MRTVCLKSTAPERIWWKVKYDFNLQNYSTCNKTQSASAVYNYHRRPSTKIEGVDDRVMHDPPYKIKLSLTINLLRNPTKSHLLRKPENEQAQHQWGGSRKTSS